MKTFAKISAIAVISALSAVAASADSMEVKLEAINDGNTENFGTNLAGTQLADQLVNGNQAGGSSAGISAADTSEVLFGNGPLIPPLPSSSLEVQVLAENSGNVNNDGLNAAFFQGAREITNVNAAKGASASISAMDNSAVRFIQ